VCAFPQRKAHEVHQRHRSQQESGGAYPDFLLRGSTSGNGCGSPLESRMKPTEATVFDRKSGAAEGSAVCPGSRTKVSVPLVPPQNRHPERSASRISRETQWLWRGVEGPRRCLIRPCCSELFNHRARRRQGKTTQRLAARKEAQPHPHDPSGVQRPCTDMGWKVITVRETIYP
jgi:hypothetical protein